MNLTKDQKSVIERVINCFETGSADGDYSKITILKDGPNKTRQITYGRSQTTEYGNLRTLVQLYVSANGIFSGQLAPYAEEVGSVPLTDDANFKLLLKRAGKEDEKMRVIQDKFFEELYFKPAINWADGNGFVLPLSALVIYDSFIHSGQILWVIRQRFPENPPALGGNEKAWIAAYVRERNKWLANHQNEIVRRTTYRTKDLKREIDKGNWDLSILPIKANGIFVFPKK